MKNQEAIEIIQDRLRQMARERRALEKALEAIRTVEFLEAAEKKSKAIIKQFREERREDGQPDMRKSR